MQRRIALAVALAFTIVTSFSVITVGARSELFGDDASGEEPPAAVLLGASPVEPTAAPAQVAPYAPEPIVVTAYVYVDEPAPLAPLSGGQTQALAADPATSAAAGATSVPNQPAPVDPTVAPPPTAAPPAATPPAQGRDDDEDERESDDEHEEEDEDEDEHEEKEHDD